MRVVISQSMYFPWVGMLEQLSLADCFVNYNDVQFSKGSFTNRVQVKTATGMRWMTVPLRGHKFGQKIDEVRVNTSIDWRDQHRELLNQSYLDAAHKEEMLNLVDDVLSISSSDLSGIVRKSMIVLADYFTLLNETKIYDAADMGISGYGSQRVLDIVKSLSGRVYITGHGARNYLDHELFERNGIEVRYMDYGCHHYQQLHGDFKAYVTGLDLLANCGRDGKKFIQPKTTNWRKFINERT